MISLRALPRFPAYAFPLNAVSCGPLPPSTPEITARGASARRSSAVRGGRALALAALPVIVCLAGRPGTLHAQTVETTLNVGSDPAAIAVNPVTNTIYVANNISGTVTVINGANYNTTSVPVGTAPIALAVNPVTNTIYVADDGSSSATAINGSNNNTTTVSLGYGAGAIAVNPVTNSAYVLNVANNGSGAVTVINGTSNNTTALSVGSYPNAVAVNPVTNTIYVANGGSNTVTVINGATNKTSTVNVGTGPNAIAVNPVTNTVYVVNQSSGTVTVINGATNATASVSVGSDPVAIALNPVTNTVYVANYLSNTVTAINGTTNATTSVNVGSAPYAIAVNPVTNTVYVANASSKTVTVINGASSTQAATTTTLTSSTNPAPMNAKLTLTATVSDTSTVPAGAVDFLDYAVPLAPPVSGILMFPDGSVLLATEQLAGPGTTTYATTALAGGIHTLFAIYGGGSSLGSSSGELVQVIDLAPAITSTASATFIVGQPGLFSVLVTGAPIPSLAVTSGMLPTGVTFVDNKNGTATLSGTPAGPGGTYPVTITASNGQGTAATQSFVLTVDQSPAITSANGAVFTAGKAASFSVTTTGFPIPSFSESGALPSGVTFVDNKNGTATLSGTPAQGSTGTYPITITANNGVGTAATQQFTLGMSQAPAITTVNSALLVVGQAGSFTVTATGIPTPSFSVTSGALPGGVTFVDNQNGTATLSGVPAQGSAGIYPFTITASNGVGTAATQSFTLTLGYGPEITTGSATTFVVGHAGSYTVTATGFPTPTLSVPSGSLPGGLTFVDNKNGTATLSGTAAVTSAGIYSFAISATNAVAAATQTFALTLGVAPVITSANSASFPIPVGNNVDTFQVTATGTPGPTFTETGDLPTGVTFNPFNGVFSGTPGAGTTGDYAITLTASNGISPNATQNFVLKVGFVPPAFTSANNATFTMGQGGIFTVTASGTPTPTLSETYPLPNGLTFNPSTGVLSGTPATGTTGTYPVVFTAVNGVNPAATQNFTLTVAPSTSTTTTIAASPNPVTYGSSVTFTAGVTPSSAAGTVVFFDDGTQFGEQSLTGGKATLSSSVLDAGTHYITANYVSNAIDVGSNATMIETVNPAPLTTTASSAFMVEGGQVPEISPTYTGLVNHQTATSLIKQPACSTTATPASPAGTYPSSCSGGAAKNYTFHYVSGKVTVYKPAVSVSPLSLTFNPQAVKTSSVSQKVTVSNSGQGPLSVTGISFSGTDKADFTATDTCGTLPASLAAGSSCAVSVTFTPEAKGSRSADLSLVTAAGTKIVTLSGTGK